MIKSVTVTQKVVLNVVYVLQQDMLKQETQSLIKKIVAKSRKANSMKRIKKLVCKIFGHKWSIYEHKTGYYSYDIEMAGHCSRCGADTHE